MEKRSGISSIDSLLVGDSTREPATLLWSEVDWNEEIEELVSSTMNGLVAAWCKVEVLLLLSLTDVAVAEVLSTP